MCLISPQEFIAKEFSADSAPHEHTVRRWIENGYLPGRRIGSRHYIDDTAFQANGNPIVEKVLRDVARSA